MSLKHESWKYENSLKHMIYENNTCLKHELWKFENVHLKQLLKWMFNLNKLWNYKNTCLKKLLKRMSNWKELWK